ncbi:MAG: transposase domain-containing protein, partial [Proteobacteria bacterium]|nr:transposase domain-containing protein [Pseudomonadota bacterium]
MARTIAELPKGIRITDYISLGVVAKTFPVDAVKSALDATGRSSRRQRELPAHVMVYYV